MGWKVVTWGHHWGKYHLILANHSIYVLADYQYWGVKQNDCNKIDYILHSYHLRHSNDRVVKRDKLKHYDPSEYEILISL